MRGVALVTVWEERSWEDRIHSWVPLLIHSVISRDCDCFGLFPQFVLLLSVSGSLRIPLGLLIHVCDNGAQTPIDSVVSHCPPSSAIISLEPPSKPDWVLFASLFIDEKPKIRGLR